MGRIRHTLSRLAARAAGAVAGAFRAVGTAVLLLGAVLDPASGAWPERRLALLVGVVTVGVLALGYVLYAP